MFLRLRCIVINSPYLKDVQSQEHSACWVFIRFVQQGCVGLTQGRRGSGRGLGFEVVQACSVWAWCEAEKVKMV